MSGLLTDHRDTGAPVESRFVVRPAVKACISSADRVLLQKEHHCDGEPFWTLPGGGVNAQETARTALNRELHEELQTDVVVSDQIGWFPYMHRSQQETVSLYRVLDCALLEEPSPNPNEGVYDCQWVEPDALPTRTLPQAKCLLRRVRTD